MPVTRADEQYAARYAALYRETNAQLIAYARALTGSATTAEDLAAEAHFRVWRRIRAGHEIENVPAYLTATVRNLAAGLGRTRREIAADAARLPEDPLRGAAAVEDPERRAAQVDLISRLLRELPDRWTKALWYAEVEDLPTEAVGEKIGASAGTTAVVLSRARERLRQAFLQSQPGTPLSEDCEPYWKQMARVVRGTASARRTKSAAEHCDECADCRARMLALTDANTRLPALLGPAILTGVLSAGAWFARALGAAGAGAAAGTAVRAGSRVGRHARLTGPARLLRHGSRVTARARALRHGFAPTRSAVFGSVAAVGIAATVATIALGSADRPIAKPRALTQQTLPAVIQPTAASGDGTASAPASASVSPSAAATRAPATHQPASGSATAPTSAALAATQAQTAQQVAAASTTSAAAAIASAVTSAASDIVAQTSQPAPASSTKDPATPTSTAATPPAATASPSASDTATPSASVSATPTPVGTQSPTPTPSQSSTPVVTSTPAPSQTVTPAASPSPADSCGGSAVEGCFGSSTPGD